LGQRFIDGGLEFVTAQEFSEKVTLLKALPQVAFSPIGYIYVPFGRKSATCLGASRFYTPTNCIVVVSGFRMPSDDLILHISNGIGIDKPAHEASN